MNVCFNFDCMLPSEYTDVVSCKGSYIIPMGFQADESQGNWLSVEATLRPKRD